MIHSYPKVYQLGHKAISGILDGPVDVTEKVDGSQFSFGVFNGKLECRSHNKQIVLDAPEKMFARAIFTCYELEKLLCPGWTYRGEYLNTPHHNALCYDRVPPKNIILFDIMTENVECYLSYNAMYEEANRLGLSVVPLLYSGVVASRSELSKLLDTVSILGGQKIEGVVIKNYSMLSLDDKIAMAKVVREDFKEVNATNWKANNPGKQDIVEEIAARYATPARWKKAIQHLREDGLIQDAPQDIGKLINEVKRDVLEEESEAIANMLFKEFWPQIARKLIAGLPEWYKGTLADYAFTDKE